MLGYTPTRMAIGNLGGGLDAEALVVAIDDERTIAAYEADKAETRSAAGGPTEFQGKARQTDVLCASPPLRWSSRPAGGAWRPARADRARRLRRRAAPAAWRRRALATRLTRTREAGSLQR